MKNTESVGILLFCINMKNVILYISMRNGEVQVSLHCLQKGDTPLHIAIRGRSRKLAELLLRNPKDGRLLYRPNKAGETPYNIDCSHQKSILTQIFGASKYWVLYLPEVLRNERL